MAIPVKPEPMITFGRIVAVELVEGKYGQQIELRLEQIPPSEFMRRWWFKPSTWPNSKWMRFVQSFNRARGSDIETADEMVGALVKIIEVERTGNFEDEARGWFQPQVERIYETEQEVYADLAMEVKDSPPFREAEDRGEITDPAVVQLLKRLYETQDEDTFADNVRALGYSLEAALRAIGE